MKKARARAYRAKVSAENGKAREKLRPSAMVAKITVGVLFFVGSFPLLARGEVLSFIYGLCISTALVSWGLVPYLISKK